MARVPTARPTESPPEATKEVLFEEDDPAKLQPRAPIVTVMGHVDHGKTSLLDALRSTEVAAGERGGITQHIGASEVVHDGKRVVFLDTPGHEAFTAMRARGARVTDIAIIVVAADDGVMPQTLEAISHAKAAKVPIIIALNKIDKPDADPTRVKTELTEAGIVIEEYGGDVPLVAVSPRAPQGLDELIEMVLLVADLQELKANPDRPAIGTIVEAAARQGPRRRRDRPGPDRHAQGRRHHRRRRDVRACPCARERPRQARQAGWSCQRRRRPRTVRGPGGRRHPAGRHRRQGGSRPRRARKADVAAKGGDGSGRATLEDLYRQIQAGQAKELRIILKSDVSGSLGAITHALEQLDQDEVRINVLHEAAGDITDNDIMLAAASNAIVVGFSTVDHRHRPSCRRGRRASMSACTTSSTS